MKTFDDFIFCCEHGELVWKTRYDVSQATKDMMKKLEKGMFEMAAPKWIVPKDLSREDHMLDAIRYGGYGGVIEYKGPPPQLITP